MSSIGSIGSSSAMMMYASKRPDASKMAEELFSKIDSGNQGYIEKSDLQSAISEIGGSDSSVDDLFSQLDSDGDGKVTENEFTQVLSQLNQQFDQMRMQGGMPPPPPPQGEDQGFSKDELTAQLEEIGSSDSKRSSLISNIINNFDTADSDGDGKVTFEEAMSFDQNSKSTSASSSSDSSTSSTSTTASDDSKFMLQIMKLMQAYNIGRTDDSSQFSAIA